CRQCPGEWGAALLQCGGQGASIKTPSAATPCGLIALQAALVEQFVLVTGHDRVACEIGVDELAAMAFSCSAKVMPQSPSGTAGEQSEQSERRLQREDFLAARACPDSRHGEPAEQRAITVGDVALCSLCSLRSQAASQRNQHSALRPPVSFSARRTWKPPSP